MSDERSTMNEPFLAAGVLDPACVAELVDSGVPGLVEELATLFGEDAPRSVAGLRAAAERGDAPELARVAHALKGSAATLGARALASTCAGLEAEGHAGRTDVGARLVSLQREVDAVVRALAELVASQQGRSE
jgi:HPt (histidine-containing phosphotransfer) domain-containing protein